MPLGGSHCAQAHEETGSCCSRDSSSPSYKRSGAGPGRYEATGTGRDRTGSSRSTGRRGLDPCQRSPLLRPTRYSGRGSFGGENRRREAHGLSKAQWDHHGHIVAMGWTDRCPQPVAPLPHGVPQRAGGGRPGPCDSESEGGYKGVGRRGMGHEPESRDPARGGSRRKRSPQREDSKVRARRPGGGQSPERQKPRTERSKERKGEESQQIRRKKAREEKKKEEEPIFEPERRQDKERRQERSSSQSRRSSGRRRTIQSERLDEAKLELIKRYRMGR